MSTNESANDEREDESPDSVPVAAVDLENFFGVYECHTCTNICLVLRESTAPVVCHGVEMQPVSACSIDVQSPQLEAVLLEKFGLPKPGIDICMCVIGEGAASATQVADQLGYERSTVTRYLNQLVAIGLLARRTHNREHGGIVNVYSGLPMEQVKRETLVGFLLWAGEAAKCIESANVKKEAQVAEHEYTETVFWDE